MNISFEIPDQLFNETMIINEIQSSGLVRGYSHEFISSPIKHGWRELKSVDMPIIRPQNLQKIHTILCCWEFAQENEYVEFLFLSFPKDNTIVYWRPSKHYQ